MPATKDEKSETPTDHMGNALAGFVHASQDLRRATRARTLTAIREGMKTAGKVLQALEEI